MAIIATKSLTTLVLRTKVGVNPDGSDIITSQKVSKVKVTAADQDIYDTASALGTLLEYSLTGISKTDETQLVNG
jgi:Protein of unknown function (DUF1659)